MMTFSDNYKLMIWFTLCVFMALGMIVFAIFYGAITFVFRKLAWKEAKINLLSIKLPKIRTALN